MLVNSSPFVMIIFGATGDLAQHKLFPALFSLFKKGEIAKQFYIVGFSRRQWTDTQFHSFLTTSLKQEESEDWKAFLKNIYYQEGDFSQASGYEALIPKLKSFDDKIGACITRIFYLATPPDNYMPILDKLHATKLSEGCGQGSEKWTRVAVEKPFGKDLTTARMLDRRLAEIFEERQIFRVDHYLGKETVQNMMAFRFANSIFEPIWNKEYIDHVQITWAEEEGVRTRGAFFDGIGILRDVGQNHLMQMIAAVAMEQPKSFTREDVRNARANAIASIECIASKEVDMHVVRGQYASYLQEKQVSPNSQTETFVAMKLMLHNPRFLGVPFYVRIGKKMPKEMMEISVVFKQTCHILFKEYGCPEVGNVLTIRIQPDEGIRLRIVAKNPGTKLSLETIDMTFAYNQHTHHAIRDAYEKILLDIFAGDQMLFNRSDELESSWQLITNILQRWAEGKAKSLLVVYPDKTWGPKEAIDLMEKDGRHWL